MAPNRLCDSNFLGGSHHSRSFVEALAASFVSFPDLRTSTFRGLPSLWISNLEINELAIPFQFSLVGFFPSKRPSLDSNRKFFFNLKLNGEVSITLLDSSHILIKLTNDQNYCRVFCHRSYLVFNCYMKLMKWSPSLDVSVESPVIPIWVAFPLLRPHLYTPRILHGLGALFGKPLKIDAATSAGSRPSMARVLVELDITKSYPKQCIGHVAGNCRPPPSSKLPVTVAKPAIKLSLLIPSYMPTVEPVEAPNLMVNAEQASGLDEDNLEVIDPINASLIAAVISPIIFSSVNPAGSMGNQESPVAAPVPVPDLTTTIVGFGDAELAVISTTYDPISIPDDPGSIAMTFSGDSPVGVCEAILGEDLLVVEPATEILMDNNCCVGGDVNSGVVDIPISVVSNEELKSHVAWSLNNSVLLQTNWLEMDESDLTPSVRKFDDLVLHVNDDMYNFMVGCVVDQAVLYGGGKRKKSKSKKK
ncbi:hypothetical protein M5K25_025919 [Dendrobium thyrsiflorum]|uniref:DUF4283 domain-containing protein n=1 Tax=Dendrobium thyrsiflorum TaxID=117978 RepID=A0ABD0TWG6_DENTH